MPPDASLVSDRAGVILVIPTHPMLPTVRRWRWQEEKAKEIVQRRKRDQPYGRRAPHH